MDTAETADRVRAVIRTCLKLDFTVELADDMVLLGGDHDVDSLDVLLMITELEREFGIKIRDGDMKDGDFATISSVSRLMSLLSKPTTVDQEA